MPQVQTCTRWVACHAGELSRHSSDFARRSGDFSRQSGDLTRPSGDVEELLEPILEEGSNKAFVQLLDDELERIHTFYLAKVGAHLRAQRCRLLSRKMQHAACSVQLHAHVVAAAVGEGGQARQSMGLYGFRGCSIRWSGAVWAGVLQECWEECRKARMAVHRQLCGSRLRMCRPSHCAACRNPGLAC